MFLNISNIVENKVNCSQVCNYTTMGKILHICGEFFVIADF